MAAYPPRVSSAVCVLGMHRSGTSAVAGMLQLLGVDLGRNLMKPGEDNPKGFFEHYEIVGCHISLLEAIGSYYDDILPLPTGWEFKPEVGPHREFMRGVILKEFAGKPLWGFKDPRACRLLPMWFPLFLQLGASPRFVIVIRNPDEIAASLAARGGHSYNQTLLVTLEHMLTAERHTRGHKRVFLGYDQLLTDWRRQIDRIGAALEIRWPNSPEIVVPRAHEFLDSKLRHHMPFAAGTAVNSVAVRGADPRIANWTFAVSEILMKAGRGEGEVDQSALDRVGEEVRANGLHLSAWRPPRMYKDRYTRMHAHVSKVDDDNQRLAKENEELRRKLGL